MTYTRLTKAALLDRVAELEKQTVSGQLHRVQQELQALGRDVLSLVAATYNAGAALRKYLHEFNLTK